MIVTVPMYRIVCDADGCDRSPQDQSDYWAWSDPDGAIIEAQDSDWLATDDQQLCDEHVPTCAEVGCDLRIRDAEFGAYCEDHAQDDSA